MAGAAGPGAGPGAAGGDGDDSLYPIAVLIDELRNEDVQVLGRDLGAEAGSAGRGAGKGAAERDSERVCDRKGEGRGGRLLAALGGATEVVPGRRSRLPASAALPAPPPPARNSPLRPEEAAERPAGRRMPRTL